MKHRHRLPLLGATTVKTHVYSGLTHEHTNAQTLTVFLLSPPSSCSLHRHSREGGNPSLSVSQIRAKFQSFSRRRESINRVFTGKPISGNQPAWIPAFAGMTIESAGVTIESAGMTVESAGMTVKVAPSYPTPQTAFSPENCPVGHQKNHPRHLQWGLKRESFPFLQR